MGSQSLRKKLDLLSAGQYTESVNANRQEIGAAPIYSAAEIVNFKAKGGTDWQDQIFRTAMQQSHQLSISGGGQNVSYYLSGSFINNNGIIKGASFKRYSLRSNIESQLSDKLKAGINLFLSQSTDHPTALNGFSGANSGSPVFTARLWIPTLSVYDSLGNYTFPSGKLGPHTLYNPLRQTTAEVNTYLNYTIIKGLTAQVMGAAHLIDDEKLLLQHEGNGGRGRRAGRHYQPSADAVAKHQPATVTKNHWYSS